VAERGERQTGFGVMFGAKPAPSEAPARAAAERHPPGRGRSEEKTRSLLVCSAIRLMKLMCEFRAVLEVVREFAMPDGLLIPQGVWLRQSGEMRLTPSDAWFPFQAEQALGPCKVSFPLASEDEAQANFSSNNY